MQTRRNKYQRDRRGYIIEEVKEKGDNKGKGKINEGTVVSNNKFRALEVEDATLEVEEIAEPILTIEEGKVENNGKNKGKEQEKLNTNKAKGSPNPSANRIGKTDQEFKRVKKEAVDKVLENLKNPTPSGILAKGDQALVKYSDHSRDGINKELTIDWVHRRFGTDKEELRQLNVNSARTLWSEEVQEIDDQKGATSKAENNEKRQTIQEQKTGNTVQATVNPSSSKTRVDCSLSSTIGNLVKSIGEGSGSLKGAINQGGSVAAPLTLEKGNKIVTSDKTGEIVAFVDEVPVYVEEKGGDEGVPMDVRKDTLSSDHQTDQGKGGDFNGTVTQTVLDHCATVNPNLGSLYELQYKMMQGKMIEVSSNPQRVEAAITPYEPTKHALVAKESAALPMVSSSGTGSPLQIKVNIPLKSPNQMLHDIIKSWVSIL
ncbi:hypothetical protein A4A49_14819 [Nicotiana attenuata]|uniref:Uncharacterized protein n=1 Tax=Nicotiana attenuata TaxID=49451 RepID=A0A314L347_NICAT|nr:hypothetical protein A4A49_14819 [Nicotiana attenuata]